MAKKSFDLAEASRDIERAGAGLPPVDKWNPDFCGDIDMRIQRDGRWFYMGSPINRPAMVKLFSRVLWKEDDRYYLKTPVEKVGIEVEDVPFFMTEMQVKQGSKGQELWFTSSTGDEVLASAENRILVEHDSETAEPSPYLEVRFGMQGLINRNIFYRLVEMAQEQKISGKTVLLVESRGEQFQLGVLDES